MSAPESEVSLRRNNAVPQVGGSRFVQTFDRSLHLAALAAALAWLLFWYRDTIGSLVDIWSRSDTFAHGFVVAPISAWLVWRSRDRLRDLPLRPSLPGVLAGAVAGFAWLLGELASVASVSQFALVGMVIALVWAIVGTAVAKALVFPLGFLFFSVPFGEFLFPPMMDRTTDFLVWALRLSSVPVFVEGRNLVIPSGHWAVVEGCSGVRYLISSVLVGSLYAYLTYHSFKKRLVFTAVSVVLPVFANWLRAYVIVMIGHLSDNRLAHGVDHFIYGWVFFGAVMMLLFWLGGRWREDDEPLPIRVPTGPLVPAASPLRRGALWVLVALAAVMSWRPVLGMLNEQGQHGAVRLPALQATAAWRPAEADRIPAWSPYYSGMRSDLREVWVAGEQTVGLYVAYYRDQGPGAELINSGNRVMINKHAVWAMTAYGDREAELGALRLQVRSTELLSTQGHILVWHWYWIGGRWTTNDYLAKLYLALSRLGGRGDDAAAVMIFTPLVEGERARAGATLETFVREMGPSIEQALAKAMER